MGSEPPSATGDRGQPVLRGPSAVGDDLEASMAGDLTGIDEVALDISFNLADLAKEAGMDAGREIPVVRTVLALARAAASVQSYMLLRKIVRFLQELSTLDQKQREDFLRDLDGDDRKRILDPLLLVLDHHDHEHKSEIEAKLLKAHVRGQLTAREYLDLRHATSAINIEAIRDLRRFYAGELSWQADQAQGG
jgi:hypothetical protein